MKKGIIILVILILIGALGGVYYYTQMKTDSNSTTTNEKSNNFNITDDIVTTAMEKIKGTNVIDCSNDPYILLISKEKYMASDLTEDLAIRLVIKNNPDVFINKSETFSDKPFGEVKASELREMVQSILGKDYNLTKETYTDGCITIKYNKEKDSYELNSEECGGPVCPDIVGNDLGKITNAKLSNNKLIVTYKILFSEKVELTELINNQYLKYYNDDGEVTLDKSLYSHGTKEVGGQSINYYYIDAKTDSVFKDAEVYKFTFEKQGDNYIFVSTEAVD